MTKPVNKLNNTELDCELYDIRHVVAANPTIAKYRARLDLLEIEAEHRNVEVK